MQSSSRGKATVRLLAIHTTEGIMRAGDLLAWKSWPGSSHATADQYGTLLDGPGDGFVDYGKASWTLRSGNPVSDNLELCALAKWTRADWLARPKLVENAAVWLARRHRARPHIPLVKLSPAEVRAGRAGVIGHNDWTVGMKDGSHWDPGPGFPWDVVLARAQQLASGLGAPAGTLPATPLPEDDMDPKIAMLIGTTAWRQEQMAIVQAGMVDVLRDEDAQTDELVWGLLDGQQGARVQIAGVAGQVAGLTETVRQLAAAGGGGTVDLDAVTAASAAGTRAVIDELAKAVEAVGTRRTAPSIDTLQASVERLAAGPTEDELRALIGELPGD